MNDSELFAFMIIMVLYGIIAIIIARNIYEALFYDEMRFFKFDKIVNKDNIDYVMRNKRLISFTCGTLWLFFLVFTIWIEIGDNVYELIIKNEDDRIASWLF
jgi:hypothetical protein